MTPFRRLGRPLRPTRTLCVLLAGFVLAGCASGPAGPAAPPARASNPKAAAARPKRASAPPKAQAHVIRRRFEYLLAVRDALPNKQSVVGLLRLDQAGSALHGRFRLFYLRRDHAGIFEPRRKVWLVHGSLLSGSTVRLDFRRAGGERTCVLFPCKVAGRLSPAALELRTPAGGAAGTVRMVAARSSDFNRRVTAIEAYIDGYDEYVAGQQIEAAKFAHAP